MLYVITDDLQEQVRIGREIVSSRSGIYSERVVANIYKTIELLNREKALSDDDIFYISVYDYWLYGFTIEEVFYLELLNRTHTEKQEFISHMDRINYMHHLNSVEDEHLLTNKYETYQYLREHYGREVIYVNSDSSRREFKEFFNKHKEFVIKPLGMATSIGVRKVAAADYDNDAEQAFDAILNEIEEVKNQYKWAYGSGVVLEEVIKQGEALARLHPASINSIRLTTIRRGDEVYIFYPVLRIGMGNNFLCCGAVGSILAGINTKTGKTETEGHNEWNEHYAVHPNTKIAIRGIEIPKWKELCSMAKTLAMKFNTINYIGWDFVFTADEEWIVMEANENGEFLGQIAYQKGLFKEFKNLIGWESPKEYWWIGKYKATID